MRLIKVILIAMILAGLLCGCNQQAQKKPDTLGAKDETKDLLNAPKEEPTISLYIKETDEKQNIKLEEYLCGVVAAEIDPSWPANALAAQAILARTFTMENIQSQRLQEKHGTDASTDIEEFQAYDTSRINDAVRKAVESTRGQVILYQGNYVKGWFSACDGGVSASAKEGLGYIKEETPYIKAGAQDGCLEISVPENQGWYVELPVQQVREAVGDITGKDPGEITGAEITEKGPSGRAEKIKLGGTIVSGPELRLALGSDKVRSMLLSDIKVQGGNLVLQGKGFGHGVGLCQWGANKLAGEGKSTQEIIEFYYQDVEIKKLW